MPSQIVVSTNAALSSTPGSTTGDVATLLGFYVPGDGGGGDFYWDAGSTISYSQPGMVVAATGGKWVRIVRDGTLNVRWCGAKGDGATDDTAAIQSSISFAGLNGSFGEVYIGPGRWKIASPLVIENSVSVWGAGPRTTLEFTYVSGASGFFFVRSSFKVNGNTGPTAYDFQFTGAGTIFQNTFAFVSGDNPATSFPNDSEVLVVAGSDPDDANEPGVVYWDRVVSTTSNTVTVLHGLPKDVPSPASGANSWGHLSHVYRPVTTVQGVRVGNFTLFTVYNAGIETQLMNMSFCRNVSFENITVEQGVQGIIAAGTWDCSLRNVDFRRQQWRAAPQLVSSRLLSANQTYNFAATNITGHADRVSFFLESGCENVLFDNLYVTSTDTSAQSGDPMFQVVGGCKNIVCRASRFSSYVARQFASVSGDSDFRTEDISIDRNLSIDLKKHSGNLRYAGVDYYGPQRTWRKTYQIAGGSTATITDTHLPAGAYRGVRGKSTTGLGLSALYVVCVSNPSDGINVGSSLMANVNQTYEAPNILIGTVFTSDPFKEISIVLTGAQGNCQVTIEIDYIQASASVPSWYLDT